MHTLYAYQQEGISLLHDIVTTSPDRAAILADPPGAGKTPQAIGLSNVLNCQRLLIVCPASLRLNWARELEKWSTTSFTTQVILNGQTEIQDDTQVIIISYHLAVSLAQEIFTKQHFDLLICDESHALKNPSSNAARAVLVTLWNRCRYRLLITGTPLPNGRAHEPPTLDPRPRGPLLARGVWGLEEIQGYILHRKRHALGQEVCSEQELTNASGESQTLFDTKTKRIDSRSAPEACQATAVLRDTDVRLAR